MKKLLILMLACNTFLLHAMVPQERIITQERVEEALVRAEVPSNYLGTLSDADYKCLNCMYSNLMENKDRVALVDGVHNNIEQRSLKCFKTHTIEYNSSIYSSEQALKGFNAAHAKSCGLMWKNGIPEEEPKRNFFGDNNKNSALGKKNGLPKIRLHMLFDVADIIAMNDQIHAASKQLDGTNSVCITLEEYVSHKTDTPFVTQNEYSTGTIPCFAVLLAGGCYAVYRGAVQAFSKYVAKMLAQCNTKNKQQQSEQVCDSDSKKDDIEDESSTLVDNF